MVSKNNSEFKAIFSTQENVKKLPVYTVSAHETGVRSQLLHFYGNFDGSTI
jgi:hypothetical protein